MNMDLYPYLIGAASTLRPTWHHWRAKSRQSAPPQDGPAPDTDDGFNPYGSGPVPIGRRKGE
ncbi:MAG: hypothetical protein ABID63_18365 [Pseudomonadota bacterium]